MIQRISGQAEAIALRTVELPSSTRKSLPAWRRTVTGFRRGCRPSYAARISCEALAMPAGLARVTIREFSGNRTARELSKKYLSISWGSSALAPRATRSISVIAIDPPSWSTILTRNKAVRRRTSNYPLPSLLFLPLLERPDIAKPLSSGAEIMFLSVSSSRPLILDTKVLLRA
jgi:hypothetical protein